MGDICRATIHYSVFHTCMGDSQGSKSSQLCHDGYVKFRSSTNEDFRALVGDKISVRVEARQFVPAGNLLHSVLLLRSSSRSLKESTILPSI